MSDLTAAVERLVRDGLPHVAADAIISNQHQRDATTDLDAYVDRLIAARQCDMGRAARREAT